MCNHSSIIAIHSCWTLLVLLVCAFLVGAIATGLVLFLWVIRPSQKQSSANQQEEQFRAIFEQSEIGINLADLSGRIIWVNSAFCNLVGYTKEELLKKTYIDLTHPSDRLPETGLTEQLLENDIQTYSLEKRYVCKNGQLKWVNVHVTQVKDKQGKTVLCSAIAEDISDRKRAEEALRQSEERFRVIFEQAAVGIAEADLSGAYLKVNQWFCDFIGYTATELMTMTFQEVTHPDDLASSFQHGRQLFTGHYSSFSLEKRFIRKDGKVLWANVSVSLVKKPDGSPAYTVAVIEDVTERKQAQAALEQSEREMTAMFNSMTDVVFMLSKEGRYLKSATASNHLLRRPVGDFPGKTVYDVFEPEQADKLVDIIHQALEAKSTIQREYSLEIKGQEVWFSTHVSPVSEDSVVWVARDISHRKQAEEALKQQAARDRTLNEVTKAIRSSLDSATLFSTAVSEFANLLQADQVILLQYAPAQQNWTSIACYGLGNTNSTTEVPLELTFSRLDREILHDLERGESVRLNNVSQATRQLDQNQAEPHSSEWLIMPIHLKQLWGCLGLMRSSTHQTWQKDEIELVSAITNQLEIAIQQAELYQQVQQLNADLEQQVQERTAVLQKTLDLEAMLKRITDKVRDSLDENQILQTAVNELGISLEVECCNAANYSADLTYNEITHEFFTQKSLGLGQQTIFSKFPIPQIFDQLLKGEHFQFCFSMEVPLSLADDCYAVLACPIFDDQGVLGDLWLFKQKHESFNDLEIRIVQQVANQCAIALRQSRLYQAAQAQVEELERLNQLKDDFLSTVSHELRTPMSNIKLSIQMLEISMEKLGLLNQGNDRLTHYLKILRDECQRETNLINDLLDLSRLESGMEPLMLSSLNLQYWLPHLVKVFDERMRNAQHQLILEIAEDLPPLETDFNYLEMILMELIHNACKYTPSGETIRIKVNSLVTSSNFVPAIASKATSIQETSPSPSAIEISIANSGTEISPQELSHVFDKFYRVPNRDPWKHGGTGLGLALVKKRVERLGGTITVTSRNNWTTFTLYLPHHC